MIFHLGKTNSIQENQSIKLIINGTALFVVKHRGSYHAYINSCPHMEIPLDWDNNQFLDSEHELIQCSTHGALFLISTGECIQGPCVGKHLKKIDVEIIENEIYWTTHE